LLETVPAVATKLAMVEPFATVTDPGTTSAAVLLESVTTAPPDPAAFESVATQFEAAPEARLVGKQATDIKAGGAESKVKDCVCEPPFKEAVTTAVCVEEIVPTVAVKVAEADPVATVTEAGTDSPELLLERATIAPPEPAGCDKVTLQVDVPPELRLTGAHDRRLTTVGANSVRDAVCELVL
jgi:hypothetical protein